MSDLVGNPEDRFSRVEAEIMSIDYLMPWLILLLFELRHEKTSMRGFQRGPTQIGLYSHKSRLDA